MVLARGKLKYLDKNLYQCHLSTNLTFIGLGSNSGFRGERPRTDCLNHSTADRDVFKSSTVRYGLS
jgi:hypothetical protein